MARHPFGGTTADFVEQVRTDGTLQADQGATCTFFTAQTGGSAIIDLTDMAANPITSVAADGFGWIPPFMGPNDGTAAMWVSAGGSSRQLILATDIPNRLTVLETRAQRGIFAATTAYNLGDIVIAPTGDIVTPLVPFTSGVSYSSANWSIVVPAAGFPGRELASAVLATTVTLSGIGVISGLTDTSHDVNTAALDVSPVVGTRPLLVEAKVACFFGTTGGYGVRLVDKTANLVLDQADVASATAFQIQEPAILRALVSPAAGARQYGIRANGTAGTNNIILDGADNLCATWIRVTER